MFNFKNGFCIDCIAYQCNKRLETTLIYAPQSEIKSCTFEIANWTTVN